MKTKLQICSAVIVASMMLPMLAVAEEGQSTSTATTTPKTIRDIRGQKKEEIKSKIEEKRDEVKQKAEDRIENKVNEFVGKLVERFNAAIDRLEKIADRISSRITKMKAEGINTTEAESLLVIAKNKIGVAKLSVANITFNYSSTTIATTTASSTSATSTINKALRNAYAITKDKVEKAKNDIKVAHKALVDVINSLKPGFNKDHKWNTSSTTNATSTATSTNN